MYKEKRGIRCLSHHSWFGKIFECVGLSSTFVPRNITVGERERERGRCEEEGRRRTTE